jgi:hypothetical protein
MSRRYATALPIAPKSASSEFTAMRRLAMRFCAAAKRLLVPAALSLVKGLRSKKDQAKGRSRQLVASSRQMESSVCGASTTCCPHGGCLTARQAAAAPRSIDPRQCRTGFGWPKGAEGRGSERHCDMTNVSGVSPGKRRRRAAMAQARPRHSLKQSPSALPVGKTGNLGGHIS